VSGAVTLAVLVRLGRKTQAGAGSWTAALFLFGYAVAFSFAYLHLPVGTGALVLFGAVQATMIGWGIARGSERPRPFAWAGLAIAIAGLVVLTFPGLAAPDPMSALLMALAGVCWGAYSLLGRTSKQPVASNADNFARTLPFAAAFTLATLPYAHVSPRGTLLAVTSGALASGLGYSLWYGALPGLSATRAAVAQLSVPALAAVAAVAFLGETFGVRLGVAEGLVLTGVTLAVLTPSVPPAGRVPIAKSKAAPAE
jgi:drug/metabolite transporter (DMT)-like permease